MPLHLPIYEDPTGPRKRPNLIDGLMRYPTKPNIHPQENQFTEAVAWLIDRSDAFARQFVGLFDHDGALLSALSESRVIGTRTQVTIPGLGGTGVLFPDLAIAGDNSAFQLFVEVKVGSDFHAYDTPDAVLSQPEAYAAAWLAAEPDSGARVKQVGTLTTQPPPSQPTSEMRARDVTWREVHDLTTGLVRDGKLESEVVAVAVDFAAAIDERILLTPPDGDEIARMKTWGRAAIAAVHGDLTKRISAASIGAFRSPEDYISRYLKFSASDGSEIALWTFVVRTGGAVNRAGQGDALGVEPRRDSDTPMESRWTSALADAGFVPIRDIDGWFGHRMYFELSGLPDGPTEAGSVVAETVFEALRASGLLPTGAST